MCVCIRLYQMCYLFENFEWTDYFIYTFNGYNLNVNIYTSWIAQLAGAVEYTDCFSADV